MEYYQKEPLNILRTGSSVEKIQVIKEMSCSDDLDTRLALVEVVLDLTHEFVRGGRRPNVLTPLMKEVLDAIMLLIRDPIVKPKLLEGDLLLEHLTLWFNRDYDRRELHHILEVIEFIAKESSILWKPASVKALIKICFNLIITPSESDEDSMIHAIKILIFLCSDNSVCYMAARGDAEYKNVWNRLSQLVFLFETPNANHSRQVILTIHLMFLLETGYNSKLLEWGLQHATVYTKKVLHGLLADGIADGVVGKYCLLPELVGFVSTLLHQVKIKLVSFGMEGNNPSEVGLPNELIAEGLKCRQLVVDLCKSLLKMLFNSIKGLICPEYIEAIAEFIVVLTPSIIPFANLFDSYKIAFRVMTELMKLPESHKKRPQEFATYLHLFTNVVEYGGDKLTDFDKELLGAVKNIELSKSANCTELDRHITCCRMLSVMGRVPFLADDMKRILHLPTLDKLLSSFVQIPTDYKESDVKATTFVIETLGVLSDNSQSPALLDLLMKYIVNKGTAFHIAAAILSGNEKLVNRALKITGSVAFSRNSLDAVAKSLSGMKAGFGHNVPAKFCFGSINLSPLATRGLVKLEELFEDLVSTHANAKDIGGGPTLISEVVALHSLKNSMHEAEKRVLKEQLYETRHVLSQMQSLNDKQSELMAKRLSSVEQKDQQISVLSHQLEIANVETSRKETEIQNNLNKMEDLKTFKEEKLKISEAHLAEERKRSEQVKREITRLKSQLEKTEKLCTASQEKVDKLSKETNLKDKVIADYTARNASLERDLRKKEDERKRFEDLLEKEKRTVDVIRGVLGNAMGGKS